MLVSSEVDGDFVITVTSGKNQHTSSNNRSSSNPRAPIYSSTVSVVGIIPLGLRQLPPPGNNLRGARLVNVNAAASMPTHPSCRCIAVHTSSGTICPQPIISQLACKTRQVLYFPALFGSACAIILPFWVIRGASKRRLCFEGTMVL